jgi:hypothetical protein
MASRLAVLKENRDGKENFQEAERRESNEAGQIFETFIESQRNLLAVLTEVPGICNFRRMTMAKKKSAKLRAAKSVKPVKSLKLAANHNEILLRS